MYFVLKLLILLFLFGIFTFHGRYGKSSVIDRPLMLNSAFIQLVYGILVIVTLIYSGFIIFTDWKVIVVGFIIHLVFRNKIEDIANLPLAWVANKLR